MIKDSEFKRLKLIEAQPITFSGNESAMITFVMLKPTKVELNWIGRIPDEELCFHCPAGYFIKTSLKHAGFNENDVNFMYYIPYATLADIIPDEEVFDIFFDNFMTTIKKNQPIFIMIYGYHLFSYLAKKIFNHRVDEDDFGEYCQHLKILENEDFTLIPLSEVDRQAEFSTKKLFKKQIYVLYSAYNTLKEKTHE